VEAPALAEAAVDLPWLAPSAGSLAALVHLPSREAWISVRGDPGLVLLWARQTALSTSLSFTPTTLEAPSLLEQALRFLDKPSFVDWSHPAAARLYQTCYSQATLAHTLAGHVPGCDPECAWIAGLLAPLGWLAMCAVDYRAVTTCPEHADFFRNPPAAQQQCWGLDHTALVRRLCRRWKLPAWLTNIIGLLGLPPGIAQTLGADPRLLQVVQLAVLCAQQKHGLGLSVGATAAELGSALALSGAMVEECLAQSLRAAENSLPALWLPPSGTPLLADYLRLACARRNHAEGLLLEDLQAEVDTLHRALEEQCAGEKERLRDQKLRALGELAAGAGHEINNPLAVISGQAQYLMGQEADPDRCKALQTIVAQTRRVHQVLTDLMQFARPKPPERELLEINEIIRDATDAVRAEAEHAQVQVLCTDLPSTLPDRLYADARQMRLMITVLLRNAIEAAPLEGWVRLRVEASGERTVAFIVEDNGPGPSLAAREHLFDPFFSGRAAGRGRGLGLTTAWRLAQLHGGNLSFDEQAVGLTRFVLELPLAEPPSLPQDTPMPQAVTLISALANVA
jgi:signal transduction histidine kinase